MPTADWPSASNGCTKSDAKKLHTALAEIAEKNGDFTFIDSVASCGAEPDYSTYSEKDLYHGKGDAIHLNNRGYCKVLTMPAVQAALGCRVDQAGFPAFPGGAIDCDTIDKDDIKEIEIKEEEEESAAFMKGIPFYSTCPDAPVDWRWYIVWSSLSLISVCCCCCCVLCYKHCLGGDGEKKSRRGSKDVGAAEEKPAKTGMSIFPPSMGNNV